MTRNATTAGQKRRRVDMANSVGWLTPQLSVSASVVHGDRAVAERLRRHQLEPSRAGQPTLVQGRAVSGDPGVDEELVLVDQIQPLQLGRALAAPEEHTVRRRVLELLDARAQVAGDVVAVGPRETRSRRG